MLSQKISPFFSNPPNWDKMSISEVFMGILSMLCEWASWGIVTLLAPSVLGAYCQLANGAQPLTSDLESAPLGLLEKWCLGKGLSVWVITEFCPLKNKDSHRCPQWAEASNTAHMMVHFENCFLGAQLSCPLQVPEQWKNMQQTTNAITMSKVFGRLVLILFIQTLDEPSFRFFMLEV